MRVSSVLRRAEGRYFHWCPACEMMHPLPDSWQFNGDLAAPTFTPSFKQYIGNDDICHYFVTAGQLVFCGDCTHSMAGKTVPLPELPA